MTVLYRKAELKSFIGDDFLSPASCQYTGSLSITFQQTAMLDQPAQEIIVAQNSSEQQQQTIVTIA